MFGSSIRVRLAVWHTATVAALLGAFAMGTWIFLGRTELTRVDASLDEMSRAFVDVWDIEREEHRSSPQQAAVDAVGDFRSRDRRIVVFDGAERLVAVSDSSPIAPRLTLSALSDRRAGPIALLMRTAQPGFAPFGTLEGGEEDERPVRAHVSHVSVLGEPYTVVALRSLSSEDDVLEAYAAALGAILPVVLLFAGVGGYLLARASLAPVVAITAQAERTSASSLHERLPVANARDELGRLATVLNGLLARLESSFEQQRRFMADASHELRTPVTALYNTAEVALSRRDRDPAELIEALEIVRGEGARLSRLVADLFLLARADSGHVPVRRELLYLEEVIQDCARAGRAMAARRAVTLVTPHADEAPFVGDSHLLHRLVMIFLDNAVKHSPAGGQVRLLLSRVGDEAYEIAVEDEGPGVPDASRERIFERFYRVDAARTRESSAQVAWESDRGNTERVDDPPLDGGGAGLGLAIARWIAAAHGGTVRLDATGPQGSRFVATLPIREQAPAAPREAQSEGSPPTADVAALPGRTGR